MTNNNYLFHFKKQGSGKGFFANMKWKEKYVSCEPGGLCYYFDSPDISNTNKVSALIALNGAYIELLVMLNQIYNNQLLH